MTDTIDLLSYQGTYPLNLESRYRAYHLIIISSISNRANSHKPTYADQISSVVVVVVFGLLKRLFKT